jgi:hypothetical protein
MMFESLIGDPIPGWQELQAPPRNSPRKPPPPQQQPLTSNVSSIHPTINDFFIFRNSCATDSMGMRQRLRAKPEKATPS